MSTNIMTTIIFKFRREDMDTKEIFDELRVRVKAADASQNAIAGALGIQQASISKFLAGKIGLSAETFLQLLLYIGGVVSFDKDTAANSKCMQELAAARKELALLRQRVVELEAECRVQERMLDRIIGRPDAKKTSA